MFNNDLLLGPIQIHLNLLHNILFFSGPILILSLIRASVFGVASARFQTKIFVGVYNLLRAC